MKKSFKFSFDIIFCIYLFSCNGNNNNNANIDSVSSKANDSAHLNVNVTKPGSGDSLDLNIFKICEKAGGLANFLVLESDARTMMDDFDIIYKGNTAVKPVDALRNQYFLTTNEISEMAAYLKSHTNDGVKIYMGSELDADNTAYPGQKYQNKTTAFIFPTNFDNTKIDPQSKHVRDVNSTLHLGKYTSRCEFIKEFSTVQLKINKFDEIYRKNPKPGETTIKDALSSSVWIDSCVIYALDKIIQDHLDKLDGALIRLAAYKTIDHSHCPSQKYPTQSTILIIPTNKDDHLPNYKIIDYYTLAFLAGFKKAPPGAFNHGELCPNLCP